MASRHTSKLASHTVLLLGGTSGIGFAVAEATLAQGANVVVSGSKQERLDTKLEELRTSHPDANDRISGKTCALSDVKTQEHNIIALLEFATNSKAKKLDHVVVTVGDGVHNPTLAELTIDNINEAFKVRVAANLLLAKHLKPYTNDAPSSSLTITSGVGAYKPAPGWTLTPIIGGMLEAFVRTMAVNFAPVRVNGVAPGAVLTEFWGGGQKLSQDRVQALEEQFGGQSLTGRMGIPEDLAELYLGLINSAFVTGQMVVVDGGWLLK